MCTHCRLYLREVFICILTAYLAIKTIFIPFPVFFIIALLPVVASFAAPSVFLTALTVFLPSFAVSFFSLNYLASLLPFISWALTTLSIRSGKKWTVYISLFFIIFLIVIAVFIFPFNAADIFLISVTLINMFFFLPAVRGKGKSVKNIDVIIKSKTENTLKAVLKFCSGAGEVNKKKANIIKWEKGGILPDKLNGDALVIAFPVHLFGAGRDFLKDVIKNLPDGKGKPVFIIYTAALYPDMAAFLLWVVLILKGYSVKGLLWKSSDLEKIKGLGEKIKDSEDKLLYEAGGDFAEGWYCGSPLTVLPSPLFLLGIMK